MDPSHKIIQNQEKPISVREIKVEGISTTNDRFLKAATKELLEAESVGDVIIGSRNVANRFKKMDMFKDVSVSIEGVPDDKNGTACNIVFKVVEAPRLYAHTGADFGSHDGNMNVSVKVRNVFGNGEILGCKSSYGISTSNANINRNQTPVTTSSGNIPAADQGSSGANEILFTKPLFADPDFIFQSSIYQLDRNHLAFMSFHERARGISAKIKSFLNTEGSITYQAGYDAVWRHNHTISPDSSISIRHDAGHSLKSSLSHIIELDTRDDIVFPSSGLYGKVVQELAGLGGDIAYLKQEIQSQTATKLPLGMTASCSLRCGYMHSFGGSMGFRKNIMVNDRFHLGGPTSVRGFEPFGLGPKEKGDSLGGNCYYACGADVTFPLPMISRSVLQGHVFANAGELVSVKSFSTLGREKLPDFLGSIGVGCGVVLRFTSFRLELNYCIPVKSKDTDLAKAGFQFGIGMHFM